MPPTNLLGLLAEQIKTDLVQAIDQVLAKHLGGTGGGPGIEVSLGTGPAPRPAGRTKKPRGPVTDWKPDRRARRIPDFVEKATGLKVKKDVIAKYGADSRWQLKDGAVLLNGKPLKNK